MIISPEALAIHGLVLLALAVVPSLGQTTTSCFNSTSELRDAIELYLDPSNEENSTVSMTYGYPIGSWCVDKIDDFSLLFVGQTTFNEPLAGWNTSLATTMSGMFLNALSFNQPINFATGSVTDMDRYGRKLFSWMNHFRLLISVFALLFSRILQHVHERRGLQFTDHIR